MASTPLMNLDLPTPSVTVGPDWAEAVNEAFETVDSHDHTPGKGTPVPVAGIVIDDDLDLEQNNLINTNAVVVNDNASADTSPSKLGSFQVVNGEFYFIDAAGNAVQITSAGQVNAAASSTTPAGMMVAYAGTSAPTGYLMCDGTAVSRATYAALFAAIGTTYGAGNGTTTFNTPNGQGRALIGAGTYTDPVEGSVTRTLGTALGASKHALITAELATHSHGITDPGHQHGYTTSNSGSPGGGAASQSPVGTNNTQSNFTGITINNTGSGTAHNNMQPSLVVNYIIKT